MHPAARALHARRLRDGDLQSRIVDALAYDSALGRLVLVGDKALGHDEKLGEIHGLDSLDGLARGVIHSVQRDGGLQRLADALVRAGGLQHAVDVTAQGDERIPLCKRLRVERVFREGLVHDVQHDVARVVAASVRHCQPYLVAGEGENGGEHLRHAVKDHPQRRLRAAALEAVLRLAVEPVLDNVEIEAGKLHHAEVVYRVGNYMELVVVVGLIDLGDKLVELGDGPAVKLQHILRRDEVVRVEAVEVAEAVARGVAELEVVLAEVLEDILRAAHVHMIVGRAGPQTHDVRAELLYHIGGIDAVAEGFVHRAALAVNGPAMGKAFLIRRALAQRAHSHQQR